MSIAAGEIIRATDIRNMVRTYEARADATDSTLSSTHEDVSGTELTIVTHNANAVLIVDAVWDFAMSNTTGNETSHLIGYLAVDNVEQSQQGLMRTLANNRTTAGQVYKVTLADPGEHTIKQLVSTSAATGTKTVQAIHTGWTALVLDLP